MLYCFLRRTPLSLKANYVAISQQFPMFYLCATNFKKGVILIPFGNMRCLFVIFGVACAGGIEGNEELH
jgi:hypothetical protein